MTENRMTATQEDGGPVGRTAGRHILNALLVAAILLVLAAAVFGGDMYWFGYKLYFVASGSMEPAYGENALVLVRSGAYDAVTPGDVIAFRADALNGTPALHRVVAATPAGYITKGDANKRVDDQVVAQPAFLGRAVWHTNLTARMARIFRAPGGFLFAGIMPLLLVALLAAYIKLCGRLRRENAPRDPIDKEGY